MDEKDERLHLGKGGMVQFGSGNVSMLVSSPDPPVIMSPAMGNTNNNGRFALNCWKPQSKHLEAPVSKI